MNIFNEILIGSWFVFLVYWFWSALSTKKTVKRGYGLQGFVIRVGTVVVLLLFFHVAKLDSLVTPGRLSTNMGLNILGAILCVGGVAFAIWARYHLGSNWGMPMSVKEKPDLVTSGPYSLVRHPIYTGVLLAIIGSTLVAGAWWLIVGLTGAAYFIYSATKEEELMRQEFNGQYVEYQKRTKMLIPFIF